MGWKKKRPKIKQIEPIMSRPPHIGNGQSTKEDYDIWKGFVFHVTQIWVKNNLKIKLPNEELLTFLNIE